MDRPASEQPIRSRKRGLFAAGAAVIPLAPIVIGIVIASSHVPARAAGGLTFVPAALSNFNPSLRVQGGLSPGSGALVALVKHTAAMRTSPGGRSLARVPTRTEFGDVAGFGGNGMFDKLAMSAAEVVESGLDGLDRNRAVVVTGLVNKLGAMSTRFAPRSTVRKIAGAIKY